uniref:DUF2335 domain-containing protein n=1 Tax=Steinernema glaseri TaxID=37863 RepID=A0A1I7Y386_9BILA
MITVLERDHELEERARRLLGEPRISSRTLEKVTGSLVAVDNSILEQAEIVKNFFDRWPPSPTAGPAPGPSPVPGPSGVRPSSPVPGPSAPPRPESVTPPPSP